MVLREAGEEKWAPGRRPLSQGATVVGWPRSVAMEAAGRGQILGSSEFACGPYAKCRREERSANKSKI